jgi:hypothetical protein
MPPLMLGLKVQQIPCTTNFYVMMQSLKLSICPPRNSASGTSAEHQAQPKLFSGHCPRTKTRVVLQVCRLTTH